MSTLDAHARHALMQRPRGHIRRVACIWLLTLGLTAAGVVLGLLVPALAPGDTPHATLHGSVGEAAGILLHNLRVLAAPVILAAAHWSEQRATRLVGDVIVAAIVVSSPLVVGVAVGRHGEMLLRFLPHVPLEWAALSIAIATSLTSRTGHRLTGRALAAYGIAVVAAASVAATVETVAVPHVARHPVDQSVDGSVDFQSTLRPPQPPEVQAFCPSHGVTTRPPRCCVRVVTPCSGRPWVPGAAAAEQQDCRDGAVPSPGGGLQWSQSTSLTRGALGPAGERRRQDAAVRLQATPPRCGGVPAAPAITLRVRCAPCAAMRRGARSVGGRAAPAARTRS
ncbi:MAG: hypothetical protein ACR2H2_01240 [Solirubrobacteraceae bacterium]